MCFSMLLFRGIPSNLRPGIGPDASLHSEKENVQVEESGKDGKKLTMEYSTPLSGT